MVEPKKRLTAAEALNHRWLGRTVAVSTKNLFENVSSPIDISDAKGAKATGGAAAAKPAVEGTTRARGSRRAWRP